MGSAGTSIAPDATPGGATMAWRSFSRKRGATRRRQCPYTRDERWRPTVPLRTHRSQAGDQEGRTHSRPSFLVVRHFWTCADRVCQFFEWDEAETQKLQSEREAEVQSQQRVIEQLQTQLQMNREEHQQSLQIQSAQFEIALNQLQQEAMMSMQPGGGQM